MGSGSDHVMLLSAANDKATAQKQMTENQCGVCSTTNTAVSWLSLLRIQGSPQQLFMPTIRLDFILESST